MSKQAFDDFMKKLQQDADMQRELKARFGKPESGIAAGELAEFAAAKGYPFAVADISTELDDAALSTVAGGLLYTYSSPTYTYSTYSTSNSLYIKFDGLSYY